MIPGFKYSSNQVFKYSSIQDFRIRGFEDSRGSVAAEKKPGSLAARHPCSSLISGLVFFFLALEGREGGGVKGGAKWGAGRHGDGSLPNAPQD